MLIKDNKTIRIAILTQPLGHNYGGLLQAFALQKYFNDLNLHSKILDIPDCRNLYGNKITKLLGVIKRSFLHYLLGFKTIPVFLYYPDFNVKNFIFSNLLHFKKTKLNLSETLLPHLIDKFNNAEFTTYIVGSDQVWRPKYSPRQSIFFLDFLKARTDIKRIAYAASFGVDNNEFSAKLLNICKPLAQKFDTISVREDSGVKLCKDLFDVAAIQVIDPTLLFDAECYARLSFERNDFHNDGDLFIYVLDETVEKKSLIDTVAKTTCLKPFRVLPKAVFKEVGPKHIADCVLPPVEQWLRGFVDAKYVVTDSFHGTVFSILFKRPFITIGNSSRGMARFTSLLKLFGLEERLVYKLEDVTEELIKKPIDYDNVYKILEREREKSKKFLLDALNS